MRSPTYRMIKSAFSPGDEIWVLSDGVHFEPVQIRSIERDCFMTDVGEILFDDHGWLWRCFEPKE